MGGSIVIIVVLTVVVPVAIIMTGLVACAILGIVLQRDVDARHVGSELWELSQKN